MSFESLLVYLPYDNSKTEIRMKIPLQMMKLQSFRAIFSFLLKLRRKLIVWGARHFCRPTDRPSVRPSIHPLAIRYKKACHVFIIQDNDFISSGYINHVKTQKWHQKFLGPQALIWAQGPK